jgi:hypothetical protein
VTQSGGTVTIGDKSSDEAVLHDTSSGTYDITDDSGIDRGRSTASDIKNAGLFEKTGGTGMSTIVPNITNNGTIEVTSGTLAFNGRILGTGSDTILGASKLQFDASVSAGQTVHFTGSGGALELHGPSVFAGSISGFDTAGAGSNDRIEVAEPWVFTGFTERAGGKEGTLRFRNGASALGLTLMGNYNSHDFVAQTLANHSTVITYNGVSAGSARGLWGRANSASARQAGARAATGAPSVAGTARSVTDLGLRSRPGRGPRWRSERGPFGTTFRRPTQPQSGVGRPRMPPPSVRSADQP